MLNILFVERIMVKSRQLFSAGEWDDVLTACFSWARCPFKWLTLTIAWKRRHYQRQGQSDVALSGYQQSTGPSAQFNRVREKSAHPNILTFHGMKAFRMISASDARLLASKRDAVPRATSVDPLLPSLLQGSGRSHTRLFEVLFSA